MDGESGFVINVVNNVDTRGSRKALGAENARLKSKIGKLCIENNQLRMTVKQFRDQIDALRNKEGGVYLMVLCHLSLTGIIK